MRREEKMRERRKQKKKKAKKLQKNETHGLEKKRKREGG
jgi:hypothetical protein